MAVKYQNIATVLAGEEEAWTHRWFWALGPTGMGVQA